MKIYIAGPMTGLPQFNFPAFHSVSAHLRTSGYEVISPAETDPPDVQAAAMSSPDGTYDGGGKVGSETWGDMLARDVKMLADGGITHIVFLPDWTRSRGARLEAFVGLLCKLRFATHEPGALLTIDRSRAWVIGQLLASFLE